jgi:phenylpropionate dioxygenase-like ring-hydroxylating dioxygenase large terminal subunit
MPLPHFAQVAIENRMTEEMAGPNTPLIRNCWYVAGWGAEVGRKMLSRRILGRQIVLYRTADGAPIALHDRCPHRSMPLSRGRLEDNQVRCGYHGLRFDTSGNCTEAPALGRPLQAMTVPAYHLKERGPLLWLWLGKGEADEATIPNTEWLCDGCWSYGYGSMTLSSNYVGLHENLLDLTHFTFLHPGNIGTPEYARAPAQVTVEGNVVRIERYVADSAVPGIYASTGMADSRISRRTVSEFSSPGIHAACVELKPLAAEPGGRDLFRVRITHFVTPQDLHSTHYFFTIARDFAQQDESATERMRSDALRAFAQDAEALEAIAENQALDPAFVEKSMRSDQAGVTMRRILKRLADAEASP